MTEKSLAWHSPPEECTYLFTFKSGGSSGYFSVCEKIKASWTATEVSKKVYVHRKSKNPELGNPANKTLTSVY